MQLYVYKRMVFSFSNNLVKDIQTCFQEEHGISLSEQEAQEYLLSFAELYLAFTRADSQAGAYAPGGRPTKPVSGDRGVSNTSGTL